MLSSMICIFYSVLYFGDSFIVWFLLYLLALFHLLSLLYSFPLFIPWFVLSTASTFGILKNVDMHIHEEIFWYTRAISRSVIGSRECTSQTANRWGSLLHHVLLFSFYIFAKLVGVNLSLAMALSGISPYPSPLPISLCIYFCFEVILTFSSYQQETC